VSISDKKRWSCHENLDEWKLLVLQHLPLAPMTFSEFTRELRRPVSCLVDIVYRKPGDVKALKICWASLFSRMKDFCESKELFNASIHRCFIRIDLIIVPSSSLQSWSSPSSSSSSSSCQSRKIDNLPKANQLWLYKCYMFLVDILSSTKLSYLVWCTTWYFVRQNIQFVIFS